MCRLRKSPLTVKAENYTGDYVCPRECRVRARSLTLLRFSVFTKRSVSERWCLVSYARAARAVRLENGRPLQFEFAAFSYYVS